MTKQERRNLINAKLSNLKSAMDTVEILIANINANNKQGILEAIDALSNNSQDIAQIMYEASEIADSL